MDTVSHQDVANQVIDGVLPVALLGRFMEKREPWVARISPEQARDIDEVVRRTGGGDAKTLSRFQEYPRDLAALLAMAPPVQAASLMLAIDDHQPNLIHMAVEAADDQLSVMLEGRMLFVGRMRLLATLVQLREKRKRMEPK